MELDNLDLEIITLLQSDGRMSFRKIGDILDTPESTIRTRYNNLVENGILKIIAITEPKKIGLNTMAIVGLKMDLKYLQEAAEKISQFNEVRLITYTSGSYDLILQVYMKSDEDLIKFMTEDLANIKGINEVDLSIQLKLYKNTFEWANIIKK